MLLALKTFCLVLPSLAVVMIYTPHDWSARGYTLWDHTDKMWHGNELSKLFYTLISEKKGSKTERMWQQRREEEMRGVSSHSSVTQRQPWHKALGKNVMQLLHIKRQIKILNITKVCSSKIHREAVPKFGAIMAENSLTTFFLEYFGNV